MAYKEENPKEVNELDRKTTFIVECGVFIVLRSLENQRSFLLL